MFFVSLLPSWGCVYLFSTDEAVKPWQACLLVGKSLMEWLSVDTYPRQAQKWLMQEPDRCVWSSEMCLSSICLVSHAYSAKDAEILPPIFQLEIS